MCIYPLCKIRTIVRPVIVFLVGLTLSFMIGCAPSLPKWKDEELKTFMSDLKKRTEQNASAKLSRLNEGIRKFSVEKAGIDFKISIELIDASLLVVIERLFRETSVPHAFNKETLVGRVTARFDNLSLIESLNALLSHMDFIVSKENGVIAIKNKLDAAPAEKQAEDKDATVQKAASDKENSIAASDISVEVFCYNTDVSKILKSLEDFYPKKVPGDSYQKTPPSAVSFIAVPNSNSILLAGSPKDVRNAVGIIRRADRKPMHVLIEASVIEVDTSALLDLGIDISAAATGEFKGISASFGSLTTNALTFTWAKQTNSPTFTSAINYLISKGKARVITRPYLATISGEKATINITNDRYVIVQQVDGGITTSTPIPVPSGAMLEITPKVISDNTILMNIQVEDSEFVTPPQNVAVQVDKNKASTIMQVESGGTIIIGGLILDRQSIDHSGAPLLSEIPLLNLLFGKQTNSKVRQEVMIFITPHIWQPDISSPVMTHEKSLITGE